MTDAKKAPQLPADPMGIFSEYPNQSGQLDDTPQKRTTLAQQAALERWTNILENSTAQLNFCNKFANQEHWLVFSEAIPICLGIHPRDTSDINITSVPAFNKIKTAVKSATHDSLILINRHDQPALWRIKPSDFVQWMVSAQLKPIPALVNTLLTESNRLPESPLVHSNSEEMAKSELIVSAALAVLANYPAQCTDDKGIASANAIYKVMCDKADIVLKNIELPLDKKATIEHLTKVINIFK